MPRVPTRRLPLAALALALLWQTSVSAGHSVSLQMGSGEVTPGWHGFHADRTSNIYALALDVEDPDSFPYQLRYSRGEVLLTSGNFLAPYSDLIDLEMLDWVGRQREAWRWYGFSTDLGLGIRLVLGDQYPGGSTKMVVPLGVVRVQRPVGERFALGVSFEASLYYTADVLFFASYRFD